MSSSPVPDFTGISGVQEASTIDKLTRFKMAIVGRPKVGKSWLACTMPGNKYVFDFDARKESISGKPNTFVKTYRDPLWGSPTANAEMEKDLKMFEYNKKQGKVIPDVFVFDSMTHWVKAAENDLFKSYSSKTRTLKTASFEIKIGASYDVANAIRAHMEDVISRAYQLGHVICVFHEEPEKDKVNSTEEKTAYTGQYVVHPYYLRTLLSSFNEVWRVEINGTQYRVQTKPTFEFGASTTLEINQTEEPSIEKIIEKHKAAIATKNGTKP